MNSRQFFFLTLSSFVVIVLVIQLFLPKLKSASVPQEPPDLAAIIQSDTALAAYIKQNGPQKTIQTLFEQSASQKFDCHQKAHQAGRLAYKIFGAEKAFKEGSGECHSGYYHGTTEGYFADNGTNNLAENLSKLCSSDLNPFFRHQCYHGVGHGLMGWAGYEINDALANCELLPNIADLGSCTTGVFMENYTGAFQDSSDSTHSSKYLSDDPHYPCNIVADRYKYNCYFLQTSRMLQILGNDFAKVSKECQKAPKDYQSACAASMGRDVGGQTRGNPAKSIEYCQYLPKEDLRTQCLLGAVQDYFWDPSGAGPATDFCKTLTDPSEKDGCYNTIIGRATQVLTDFGAKDNFCQQVEEGYRRQCKDTLL